MIRQQSIIYPHIFFTDLGDVCGGVEKMGGTSVWGSAAVVYFLIPILGIVSWLV